MATISEDYVSDETFKLLKEKGFDDSCCRFVVESDETYHRGAPTLQMSMKWLRDIHNLFIEIQCYGCEYDEKAHFEYSYVISEYVEFNNNNVCTTFGLEKRYVKSQFLSYEKACEAAIKYCLENLI